MAFNEHNEFKTTPSLITGLFIKLCIFYWNNKIKLRKNISIKVGYSSDKFNKQNSLLENLLVFITHFPWISQDVCYNIDSVIFQLFLVYILLLKCHGFLLILLTIHFRISFKISA